MPGFVKDETKWEKAKAAAAEQAEHGTESFWRLANFIYHKMDKSETISIGNSTHFTMKDILEPQSIKGNEVTKMSDEKKYSAQEAAAAVLKKAGEMLKSSKMFKNEDAPKEKVEGEPKNPGNRIESQPAPEKNPKEQAEGNNELAGTTPTQVGQDGKNLPGHAEIISGHIKLAKFIGRMHAKRKTPPGAM